MIVPCGHRVLVKPDTVDEKKGGLYVPVQAKERMQNEQILGTIIEIGETAWKAFDDGVPWAKKGDKIYYARNGGWKIKDQTDGSEYVLLNDEDICAILKEKGA